MYPDSKVHGANMGPTCVLSAPDGPHVGPMNLAIRVPVHIDLYSETVVLVASVANNKVKTVQCRHKSVCFLCNPHNTQSISRPWKVFLNSILRPTGHGEIFTWLLHTKLFRYASDRMNQLNRESFLPSKAWLLCPVCETDKAMRS